MFRTLTNINFITVIKTFTLCYNHYAMCVSAVFLCAKMHINYGFLGCFDTFQNVPFHTNYLLF